MLLLNGRGKRQNIFAVHGARQLKVWLKKVLPRARGGCSVITPPEDVLDEVNEALFFW